ncbi:MAG: TlpA disulfide reductase family protein [Pyrinomonadaceae bacterium]
MKSHFALHKLSVPSSRALTLAICALCLALLTACSNTPTRVSNTTSTTNTPVGAVPPRTSVPMPPPTVKSSHEPSVMSWTLLDSRRVKLSDYAGQVVVLDFWATYCPPCREETPHLVELQRRYAQQGLRVIGLNVGGPEDRPKIADFLEQYKVQYPQGFPDEAMERLYFSTDDSIPQTVVFDRKGSQIKHFVGYDSTVPAQMERIVQAALAEKQ